MGFADMKGGGFDYMNRIGEIKAKTISLNKAWTNMHFARVGHFKTRKISDKTLSTGQ